MKNADNFNPQEIRVLLAEDNLINQKVTLFSLNKSGFVQSDLAENGQIALDLYSKQPYDLVLMDIQMPIMDGVESTKRIRQFELENNLPKSIIIAITANVMEEEKSQYMESGLDDIIAKPLIFEDFLSTIGKYFHKQ